jgi:hypothetical protein
MQGSFPALEIKPRAHGGARMMMKDTEGIVAVALFALAIESSSWRLSLSSELQASADGSSYARKPSAMKRCATCWRKLRAPCSLVASKISQRHAAQDRGRAARRRDGVARAPRSGRAKEDRG